MTNLAKKLFYFFGIQVIIKIIMTIYSRYPIRFFVSET